MEWSARTRAARGTEPTIGQRFRGMRSIETGEAAALDTQPNRVAVSPSTNAGRRSPILAVAERVLGIDSTGERQLFPTYTELRVKVPLRVWQVIRVGSIAGYLTVIAMMFVRPAAGLFVFFHVIVPLFPLLIFVAPGVWRNICPLAAANQIPRVMGFGRGRTVPDWLRNRSYSIAVMLFFGFVAARLSGLDGNATAMGEVLGGVVVVAFAGGVVFKGKSGWCSSICPLLPLQRAYGQTPLVTVPNSHCPTCVGCAKNCYDFKPRAAYQADLADPDSRWSAPRKFFAAALPGFVLGFFTMAVRLDTPAPQKYGLLILFVLVSVGLFSALENMSALSPATLTATYCAAALNIYYWFCGPSLASALEQITDLHAPWLRWPISAVIAVLTLLWIARTRVSALQFAFTTGVRSEPILLRWPTLRATSAAETGAQVRFEPHGNLVAADVGTSLLKIAEQHGQPIEAGCRMGICGADPVAVLDGMSCLSPPEQDELDTLRRLGYGRTTRMACCAKVNSGVVRISMSPEPGVNHRERPSHYDRSIGSVVVIGNGIAGVTAADFIRRGHPDCEIHVVGQEPHSLYNRMGISRLVYGRTAMAGLHLLPEHWNDEQGVTAWLNTVATRIDLRSREILLGTRETLRYDRLILAMGASADLPAIDGLCRPGSFVLRKAEDAMNIRTYVQEHDCHRAVVAGGGLLGLEAAVSLQRLGLQVTLLERGARLLSRHVDPRCSELVGDHFANAGIEILREAEPARVSGTSAVTGAVLKDGRVLPCEVFLSATGIRPNVDLARDAGVPAARGVLVDDRMHTRVPDVFAAGDVAEHAGRVLGLWPTAAEQARTAAVNALGGNVVVSPQMPATILKGVGLDLFSIGRADATPHDQVIVVDRPEVPSYRLLVLFEDRVIGAVILGHHPTEVAAVQKAFRNGITLGAAAQRALRAGDWSVLSDVVAMS
jgi:NADPH-dependent 2,4-dienoyl-CoA reductase/sulfur reductase-like enzyme/ferredoxin